MDKNKKIILFISIALSAIVVGIMAALLFSSLGKGSAFKTGACVSRKYNDDEQKESEATPDPNQIVITTEEPTPQVSEKPEETAEAKPEEKPVE